MKTDLYFGEKLRELRKNKGLSQQYVADNIGISLRAYSSYENNNVRPRHRKIYDKLAKCLSCDVNTLFNSSTPPLTTENIEWFPTWKGRPKSNIVKWILQHGNMNLKHASDILGVTVNYFNNKLYRNSFSIDDLIILSETNGLNLVLFDPFDNILYPIRSTDYFLYYNEDFLKRKNEYKQKIINEKQKIINEKQNKILELEKEIKELL